MNERRRQNERSEKWTLKYTDRDIRYQKEESRDSKIEEKNMHGKVEGVKR